MAASSFFRFPSYFHFRFDRNPNVTTLRSGLCYRNSVCRLSVTLVHPTQGVEAFGNTFSPLCTLIILWPPYKILRRLSQGNPSVGGVNHRMGCKIERFWTCRRLYLINGMQDRRLVYYPNVSTLRSGLCCRNSVSLSSVVCLLSVLCL